MEKPRREKARANHSIFHAASLTHSLQCGGFQSCTCADGHWLVGENSGCLCLKTEKKKTPVSKWLHMCIDRAVPGHGTRPGLAPEPSSTWSPPWGLVCCSLVIGSWLEATAVECIPSLTLWKYFRMTDAFLQWGCMCLSYWGSVPPLLTDFIPGGNGLNFTQHWYKLSLPMYHPSYRKFKIDIWLCGFSLHCSFSSLWYHHKNISVTWDKVISVSWHSQDRMCLKMVRSWQRTACGGGIRHKGRISPHSLVEHLLTQQLGWSICYICNFGKRKKKSTV